MDPKNTVHLPKTAFPMRAALSEREPAQVKAWEDHHIYEQLLAKNARSEKFVFHDGPPYANGAIHQGHFLNKILKDLVVKYHLLAGHLTDFVPGWDCHGLPIERQVDKQLGAKKRELSVAQFRRACRKYAEEQIDLQRKDFKRLGIFARWDHPYETMDFRYEAEIVRELARIVRLGALYRRKRPVHWCFHDVTALAEAEVEYADKTSPPSTSAFPWSRAVPRTSRSPSGPPRPGPFPRTSPSPPIPTSSTWPTICPAAARRWWRRISSTPSSPTARRRSWRSPARRGVTTSSRPLARPAPRSRTRTGC